MFSSKVVYKGAFSYVDRKTPKVEKKVTKRAFNYILKALNGKHSEKTVRAVMHRHGWPREKVDLMFSHIAKDTNN